MHVISCGHACDFMRLCMRFHLFMHAFSSIMHVILCVYAIRISIQQQIDAFEQNYAYATAPLMRRLARVDMVSMEKDGSKSAVGGIILFL